MRWNGQGSSPYYTILHHIRPTRLRGAAYSTHTIVNSQLNDIHVDTVKI